MSKPKHEVGDKFVDGFGSTHEVFALSESVVGNVSYWVDDNGNKNPWTIDEKDMDADAWIKIGPFLEEGVTYAHKSAVKDGRKFDTWKIVKVCELDGKREVWAIYTNGSTGSRCMTTMMTSRDTYGKMVEVARDLP